MTRLPRPPVICIVTRVRGAAASGERSALIARLSTAAGAGASMIQVRDRQVDDRTLLEFTSQLVAAVRSAGTLVLVNERTDVALAGGADGIHLRGDGPTIEDVRRTAPALLIGRSVHSEDEAAAAAIEAPDYLVFGTVFQSTSKSADHPLAGPEGLARVCRRVTVPVLAIGGITVSRAATVAAAGAAGIAGVSLFTDAPDIGATVAALRAALTPSTGNV